MEVRCPPTDSGQGVPVPSCPCLRRHSRDDRPNGDDCPVWAAHCSRTGYDPTARCRAAQQVSRRRAPRPTCVPASSSPWVAGAGHDACLRTITAFITEEPIGSPSFGNNKLSTGCTHRSDSLHNNGHLRSAGGDGDKRFVPVGDLCYCDYLSASSSHGPSYPQRHPQARACAVRRVGRGRALTLAASLVAIGGGPGRPSCLLTGARRRASAG